MKRQVNSERVNEEIESRSHWESVKSILGMGNEDETKSNINK